MVNEVAHKGVDLSKDKKKVTINWMHVVSYSLIGMGAISDAIRTGYAVIQVAKNKVPNFSEKNIATWVTFGATGYGRIAQSIALEGPLTATPFDNLSKENLLKYFTSLGKWWRSFFDSHAAFQRHILELAHGSLLKFITFGAALSYFLSTSDSFVEIFDELTGGDVGELIIPAIFLGLVDAFQAWQYEVYIEEFLIRTYQQAALQWPFLPYSERAFEQMEANINAQIKQEHLQDDSQIQRALAKIPGWRKDHGFIILEGMTLILTGFAYGKAEVNTQKKALSRFSENIDRLVNYNPALQPYREIITDTLNDAFNNLLERVKRKIIKPKELEDTRGLLIICDRAIKRSLVIKLTQNMNNKVWIASFVIFGFLLSAVNAGFAHLGAKSFADRMDWQRESLSFIAASWTAFLGAIGLSLSLDGIFIADRLAKARAKQYHLPVNLPIEQEPGDEKIPMQEGAKLERGGFTIKPSKKALVISGTAMILGGLGVMCEAMDGSDDLVELIESMFGGDYQDNPYAIWIAGGTAAFLALVSNISVDSVQAYRFFARLYPKKAEAASQAMPAQGEAEVNASGSWYSSLSLFSKKQTPNSNANTSRWSSWSPSRLFKKARPQQAENAAELMPLRPSLNRMTPGASVK